MVQLKARIIVPKFSGKCQLHKTKSHIGYRPLGMSVGWSWWLSLWEDWATVQCGIPPGMVLALIASLPWALSLLLKWTVNSRETSFPFSMVNKALDALSFWKSHCLTPDSLSVGVCVLPLPASYQHVLLLSGGPACSLLWGKIFPLVF